MLDTGYPLCTTIGHASSTNIDIIGEFLCDSLVFFPNLCIELMLFKNIALKWEFKHTKIQIQDMKGLYVIVILADEKNPLKGVIVKMSSTKPNCSLTVSVICDTNGVQVAGFCS